MVSYEAYNKIIGLKIVSLHIAFPNILSMNSPSPIHASACFDFKKKKVLLCILSQLELVILLPLPTEFMVLQAWKTCFLAQIRTI